MRVIKNDIPIEVDVDETLLVFKYPVELEDLAIEVKPGVKAVPHYGHIEQIKEHWARGHYLTVWSAGGWEWAEKVVDLLGIRDYFNDCRTKTRWFYDDRPADFFMPEVNRIYIPIEKIREHYERQRKA